MKRLTLKVNTNKKDKKVDTAFQTVLAGVMAQVKNLVKSRMDSKLDSLAKLGQAIKLDNNYNLRKDFVASYVENKPQRKADYCADVFNLNSVIYDNILIGVNRSVPVELWYSRTHQNFLKPLFKATGMVWGDIEEKYRIALLNPNIPVEEKQNIVVKLAKAKGLEVLTEKRKVIRGTFSGVNVNSFTESQLQVNPYGKTEIHIPVYQMDKKTKTLRQKDKLEKVVYGDMLNVLEPVLEGLKITIDRLKASRGKHLEEQKTLAKKMIEVKAGKK